MRREQGEISIDMRPRLEPRMEVWAERLTLLRAIGSVVAVALVLVLVAGLLERLVEPETFKNIGLAYWWAATTVTTVGYGDVVPHTQGGRVIAVCLMLLGFSLIPLLASVIVSVLIAKRTRAQQEQIDLERQEHAAALARIEERLAHMERDSGLG